MCAWVAGWVNNFSETPAKLAYMAHFFVGLTLENAVSAKPKTRLTNCYVFIFFVLLRLELYPYLPVLQGSLSGSLKQKKAVLFWITLLFWLVPAKGVEPSTFWLQVSCSTNWAKPARNGKIGERLYRDFYFLQGILQKLFINQCFRQPERTDYCI